MKLKIKADYFPKWEEVEKGKYCYEVTGRFIGLGEFDEPRFANTHRYEVIINHRESNMFTIFIQYDKKDKNPYFILKMFNWVEHFDYSEDGYELLMACIEKNINYETNKLCDYVEEKEQEK
jgi:hypothetical protein